MAKDLQTAVKNLKDHMVGREFPLCFTKKEYKAWLAAEVEAPTKPLRHFVCRDCTTEFRNAMACEGRCVNEHVSLRAIAK